MKKRLFFTLTLFLFSSVSLIIDFFNYNPYESGTGVFVNFFVSLFIFGLSFFTLALFYLRMWIKKTNMQAQYWTMVRQATLISVALTVLTILKVLKILDWWVAGPLVIAVFLLELFFQTMTKHKKQKA